MRFLKPRLKSFSTLIIVILLVGICSVQSIAQNTVIFKGKVFDASATFPLIAGTVSYQLADSIMQPMQVLTNDSGYFSITLNAPTKLTLSISYGGYIPIFDTIYLSENNLLAKNYAMQPMLIDGEEVVIIGTKPAIENRGDTLIMNIASMPNGETSSASELLEQIPMAGKDANGNLSVKGVAPRILIDDKPVELSVEQLNEFLESLPGSMIERIEVLQTPPPEYATDGGSVINIVTAKGKIGLTSKFNVAYGSIGEKIAGINATYRNAKWNVMLNTSYRNRDVDGDGYSNRTNNYKDSSNQYLSIDTFNTFYTRPNIRLQVDYNINKNSSWSIVMGVNANKNQSHSDTRFEQINSYNELWKLSKRAVMSKGNSSLFSPQISYNNNNKKTGTSLKASLNYNISSSNNTRWFQQDYYDIKNQMVVFADSVQRQNSHQKNGALTARVNYNMPVIKKFWTMSAGLSFQQNTNPQTVATFNVPDDNFPEEFDILDLLSSDVEFLQAVSTARIANTFILKNSWRITGQVQAEYTQFNAEDKASANINNNYLNWLPYLRVRKEWSKELNGNFIYRKSIRRPSVNQLSPIVYINDPFNIRTGNPFLDPAVTDEFEFSLNYQKGRSFVNNSISFKQNDGIIQSIRVLTDTGVTVTTYQNVASSQQYAYNFGWGISFNKNWRLNTSGSFRYNTYGKGEANSQKYKDGMSANGSVQLYWWANNFLSANGSMSFNRVATPQGIARSTIGNRFGVQYKLLDRKMSIGVSIANPFTPQNQVYITEGPRFYTEQYRTIFSRNYQISVSYQLTKTITKKPKTDSAEKLLQYGAKKPTKK